MSVHRDVTVLEIEIGCCKTCAHNVHHKADGQKLFLNVISSKFAAVKQIYKKQISSILFSSILSCDRATIDRAWTGNLIY
jgi:hypothetical protein